MLNVIRFVLILMIGLVVFGWSLAAGQTPKPHARPYGSTAFQLPVSQPVFDSYTLTPRKLAAPSAVRRPRLVARDPRRAFELVELDSVPSLEPKLTWLANAEPLAAATLKTVAAESAVASHVVALTPKPVAVDLRILSQHVASHNLSVRAIEDRLRQQQHWDLANLEAIARQLEDLSRARELWLLYYRVLEARKRRALTPIASWDKCVELLRQRLFEAQVVADADHAIISGASKEETKRRLSVLDERTQKWRKRPE